MEQRAFYAKIALASWLLVAIPINTKGKLFHKEGRKELSILKKNPELTYPTIISSNKHDRPSNKHHKRDQDTN